MAENEEPEEEPKAPELSPTEVVARRELEEYNEIADEATEKLFAEFASEAAEQAPEEETTEDAPEEDAAEEEQSEPEEGTSDVEESGTAEPDEDLRSAQVALMRSGFKPSDFEDWDRDEILLRGQQRAEVLRLQDDLHRQIRETKASEPVKEQETPDILKPLTEALDADEEAVKPLVDVITSLSERLKRAESKLDQNAERTEAEMFSATRAKLEGTFPELIDDGRMEALRGRMDLIGKDFNRPGRSTSENVLDCMIAAARSLGMEERSGKPKPKPSPATTRDPVQRKKRSGGPTPVQHRERARKRAAEMTEGEIASKSFEMIMDGKTDREIRRALG